MPVERHLTEDGIYEILERVLDKGIVIDAWLRVSVIGIQLVTVETRIVVASIETYLKNAELICAAPLAASSKSHPLTS